MSNIDKWAELMQLALYALERASESLGSFVSDHGWGQADMDTLDSVISAELTIKKALAQPEQEPVGIVRLTKNYATDRLSIGVAWLATADELRNGMELYVAPQKSELREAVFSNQEQEHDVNKAAQAATEREGQIGGTGSRLG